MLADSDYDQLIDRGVVEPRATSVQAEIGDLLSKANAIRHDVERRVARYDTRGVQEPLPTFNDLDECLETLQRLIKKYKILLTGSSVSELLPVIQYDWKAIFYFPWISRITTTSHSHVLMTSKSPSAILRTEDDDGGN
jgi:hypothetical protein